ncbi:hypothetical protein T484DRAFT_1819281 [Baffinella frigidus]|nr:hypothetical protein T484DRAFT_1819281 [Cryptophyta sp. CCMP2293]
MGTSSTTPDPAGRDLPEDKTRRGTSRGGSKVPHALLLVVVVAFLAAGRIFYSGEVSTLQGLLRYTGLYSGGMVSFSKEYTASMNAKFGALPESEQPEAVLKWVNDTFEARRWAQVTSFGPTGIVVTHLLRKLGISQSAQYLTIDTLHLFPQTYELMERCKAFFGLQDVLKVFFPKN